MLTITIQFGTFDNSTCLAIQDASSVFTTEYNDDDDVEAITVIAPEATAEVIGVQGTFTTI